MASKTVYLIKNKKMEKINSLVKATEAFQEIMVKSRHHFRGVSKIAPVIFGNLLRIQKDPILLEDSTIEVNSGRTKNKYGNIWSFETDKGKFLLKRSGKSGKDGSNQKILLMDGEGKTLYAFSNDDSPGIVNFIFNWIK
jgi:hypothetical protein